MPHRTVVLIFLILAKQSLQSHTNLAIVKKCCYPLAINTGGEGCVLTFSVGTPFIFFPPNLLSSLLCWDPSLSHRQESSHINSTTVTLGTFPWASVSYASNTPGVRTLSFTLHWHLCYELPLWVEMHTQGTYFCQPVPFP